MKKLDDIMDSWWMIGGLFVVACAIYVGRAFGYIQ